MRRDVRIPAAYRGLKSRGWKLVLIDPMVVK